jgi:hypothetical protein
MAKIAKARWPPFGLLHEGNQKTPSKGKLSIGKLIFDNQVEPVSKTYGCSQLFSKYRFTCRPARPRSEATLSNS